MRPSWDWVTVHGGDYTEVETCCGEREIDGREPGVCGEEIPVCVSKENPGCEEILVWVREEIPACE